MHASSFQHYFLGLPATSIALDEYRVYWTNSTSGGIFFAWRNSTSSAVVFNSTVAPSAIFSISPGQQPLPRKPFSDVQMPCIVCRSDVGHSVATYFSVCNNPLQQWNVFHMTQQLPR